LGFTRGESATAPALTPPLVAFFRLELARRLRIRHSSLLFFFWPWNFFLWAMHDECLKIFPVAKKFFEKNGSHIFGPTTRGMISICGKKKKTPRLCVKSNGVDSNRGENGLQKKNDEARVLCDEAGILEMVVVVRVKKKKRKGDGSIACGAPKHDLS
jgi:hypothetical protein